MTQSIIIFAVIAIIKAVMSHLAKKAKEKQAAAEAASAGAGAGVSVPVDGTRPVLVRAVRPMTEQQATAVALLIERGKVLEAIMSLRAICNLGLAEARDAVAQFPARGFPAELLMMPTQPKPPVAPAPPISGADEEEADDGEGEESGDALHSLEHVQAAGRRIRSGSGIAAAPEPAPKPAPAALPSAREAATLQGAGAAVRAAALRSKAAARQAFVWAEIIGPPRAVRPLR